MNLFDLAEQANLEMSRVDREEFESLNVSLSYLDERALKFDPDPAHRSACKLRLCAAPEPVKMERNAA